jgi:hypothetical protein
MHNLTIYTLSFLVLLGVGGEVARAQVPTVMSRTPARNTNTVALSTSVAVTFSQPIAAATAAGIKIHSAQAGGRKAGIYSTAGPTVTFQSVTSFKPGETVLVSIPATVQNTNGVAAAQHVYQFTTAVSGTGVGNFRAGTETSTSSYCAGLATGDVDGDGDLDLVTVSATTNTAAIRLNGGNAMGSNTGVFSGNRAVVVGFAPHSVALADIDGDGDLDLLATLSQPTNAVAIRLNDGNASGSNTGFFTGGSSVSVGADPYGLAVGDVDGDGDLDLVTANASTGTVSVRLNGGDATGSNSGVFSGTQEVAVGSQPQNVVLADVDNDGDLDLLTANYASNTVSVRLNGGNASGSNTGIFTGTQNVRVNSNPTSLATGDIDGDGDLDFIAATASLVSVGLNGSNATGSGTGVFSSGQSVVVTGTSGGVALGDVDADGDLDLVASDKSVASPATNNTVSVRLNGGNARGSNSGIFSGGYNPEVGMQPQSLALGDVDGDGDLDLLATNYASGTVSVRLNQPPPPLISSVTPSSGVAGTVVTVTGTNLLGSSLTVNGQVLMPTTVTDNNFTFTIPEGAAINTGTIILTKNTGVASAPFTILFNVTSIAPLANSLAAPHANSAVQLAFSEPLATTASGGPYVFSNLLGGYKAGTTSVAGNTLSFAATSGTVRTNFAPGEIISVSVPAAIKSAGGLSASKRVYRFTVAASGSGQGNFQPGADVLLEAQPYGIAVGDVDGDGDQDLVASTYGTTGQGNTSALRLNNGNGTFTYASLPSGYGTDSGVIDVTLADVDNDGDLDIISANALNSSTSVFLNNGAGRFVNRANPTVRRSPRRVITADVDGDGDLDLLTVGADGFVSIRLNLGDGNFYGGSEVTVGDNPLGLTTADIDGDGDLDLLTANNGSNGMGNTVSIRLNNGTGTFSGNTEVVVGTGPSSVAVADVDGDGDLDLLAANGGPNWTGNTVSVRLNNGSGNFSGSAEVAVGTGPSYLLTADVDADGDQDLLTANYATNTVSVRLNNGTGTFNGGADPQVDTNTFSGRGAQGLALADLDGDSDLDLVVANSGNLASSTVSVRFNQVAPPALLGFTPAVGPPGIQVVLTGTNLASTTAVAFNGISANFTINSATQLTAIVPTTATTGPVSITAAGSTVVSTQVFTVSNVFTVQSFLPTRNQLQVPRSAALAVSFDAPVSTLATSLGALRVFSAQHGGRKAGTATVNGNILSFNPSSSYQPGETVMATLTTGVKNSNGLNLARGQVVQFTVGVGAGTGTFTSAVTVPMPPTPHQVLAADMNGDGTPDILSSSYGSYGISLRFNTGTGTTYTGTATVPMPEPSAFGVADLDNDGALDVFGAAANHPRLTVCFNNGQGTSFSTSDYIPTAISTASKVLAADLNADGFLDLLAVSGGQVSVRLNDGARGFTGTTDISLSPAGSLPFSIAVDIAVADVDSDGDWDLLTANYYTNTVSIRLNDGTGTFNGGTDVVLTYEPKLLSMADVNGDGILDALVSSSSFVQTLLGTGVGSFTSGSKIIVGTDPRTMTTGDIDGDGDLDLITANLNSSSVSVRFNDGRGNFSGSTNLVISNPMGVALTDMNGDSILDLLTNSYRDNYVAVYLSKGVVTATRSTVSTMQVDLFPLPAHGQFSLKIPARASSATLVLTLVDAVGRAVLKKSLPLTSAASIIAIDVAQLPPGIYTLQGVASEQLFTKRVVLE